MTREEFIEVLDKEDYSYELEGDKIVVTHRKYYNINAIGNVSFEKLTSLPPGVEFINTRNVHLKSVTSIPPGVEFNNGGDVSLKSITGRYFSKWDGNIDGIDSKRLLNFMISKGMFI